MPDDTAPDNTAPKETAPEVAPHAAPLPAVTPPAYTPPVGRLPSFTPPQYAQAEYVRPATSTPPETPRRPLSPLVIGLIVGGAVLLVVAIVASAVTVTNYFTEVASGAREPFGAEPAIEGEKASPLALNPTRCDDECFTEEVVAGAASLTDEEFETWGLTEFDDGNTTSSIADEYDYTRDNWESYGGSPESCFVAYPQSPILDELEIDDDTVRLYIDGTHSDSYESTYFQQTARYFADSASAVDFMVTLDEKLDGCSSYSYTIDDSEWAPKVTRAVALDIPANVAAIGWSETTEYGRYYSVDVQRGNLVVRTMVTSYDGMTEHEFRSIVEGIARNIAYLDQVGE